MSKSRQRYVSWCRKRWVEGLRRHATPTGIWRVATSKALDHLERFSGETTPRQVMHYTRYYVEQILRLQ